MSSNLTENSAVNFLKRDGYVILSRNRRIGGVEIDIMALRKTEKEKVYYLIEVKKVFQSHYSIGFPPVSFNQIQRYLQAIDELNVKCGKFLDVRFSIMLFNEKNKLIEFIENMPFLNRAS